MKRLRIFFSSICSESFLLNACAKSSSSQKSFITLNSLRIMAWGSLVTTIFSHVMIFSKNFLYTPVDNQSVRPKTHVTLINKNES